MIPLEYRHCLQICCEITRGAGFAEKSPAIPLLVRMTVATWGIPGFFCCIYRRKIHAIFFVWQAAAARQVIFFRIDIAYIGRIFVFLCMSPIGLLSFTVEGDLHPVIHSDDRPLLVCAKNFRSQVSKTTESLFVGMAIHIAFAAGNSSCWMCCSRDVRPVADPLPDPLPFRSFSFPASCLHPR